MEKVYIMHALIKRKNKKSMYINTDHPKLSYPNDLVVKEGNNYLAHEKGEISSYESNLDMQKENSKFNEWVSFLEKQAKIAYQKKSMSSNYVIVRDVIGSLSSIDVKSKFTSLDFIFKNIEREDNVVSLPSLFHTIKFIREIHHSFIKRSVFFIDKDSLYVNMSFITQDSRLDLTFMDNGEVNFRVVDCEKGRVRITGSSFFGVGKNQGETKKINKLFQLACRVI